MFKKLDFMKVSKDLNALKDVHKEYSTKELSELLALVGLPINGKFKKSLVNNKILSVTDRGRSGTFYKFNEDSVFYLNIEAAYRQHRKERNSYKYNKRSNNIETSDELAIQNAITLLLAQGDRFKITEKIVTVEYKDL